MASNPENVRLTVLMKLQEALDEEAILEEQMLALMHRFSDRFMDRRVEINNLMVLHDHPLIDYGKYDLRCMTGADMEKCVELKGIRDELTRLLMNIMSFNSCGLGANKCNTIAKLCIKHKVSFLGIQETHATKLDPFKIKRTWGNSQFDFVESLASGRSGGLVSIWDPNVFSKVNDFRFENLLIVEERFGSVFNHASANVFNQFIRDAHLWDIPLGAHLFTRFNKHGDKLSKLDRFLTSDSFAPFFQKFSSHVLDCLISDHRPILLSHASKDFGPTPFKFYNSWLLDKSLHLTIADFWDNFSPINQANPIVSFKNKMKALKVVIKEWNLKRKDSLTREKEELSKKIMDFDANISSRSSNFIIDSQRALWIDRLRDIELKENTDASQKAKIRWDIEADENSNFFHAMVNQKRRSPFYKSITSDQNIYLASPFSESERKLFGTVEFWNVVKSDVLAFVRHFFRHSDFCPISLIGAQYKIIAKVLAKRLARVIDTVISMEQSAFIKQRQILDGPLMVNEVIQWCKRKKSKLMVFKVDFEKAFDTISWDFLFQVLNFMGFNETWIRWISGCLHSAAASILINGSPTCEFNIHRGLRQGDPLSAFLFIIAMEGLHVAIEDAMSAGLYNGFRINTLNLSHLFLQMTPYSLESGRILILKAWSQFLVVFTKSLVSRLTSTNPTFLVSGGALTMVFLRDFGLILGWNNGWHLYWSRNISSGTNANLLNNLLSYIQNMALNDSEDVWVWSSGNSAFSVKDARGKIDDGFLPDDGFETSRRGIEVASITCPTCDNGIDTSYHTMWVCSLATTVWNRVFIWLDLSPPDFSSLRGLFSWLDDLHISSSKKDIIEVVCDVVLWSLWNFRNDMIFGDTHLSRSTLFDKIVDFSFR
nr:RNA-directed DNA polymerase, eukaryota, reverse transcriptase zinc-binding domain protein [Tanacetum cinerariifolium]